jgi:hypothetical protein
MKAFSFFRISGIILIFLILTVYFVHEGKADQCTVIAWNDLGMHCMDNDFSVFAILPPYNTLHAQLIDKKTGILLTEGAALTYEATKDTHKSINTSSFKKTNFWNWAFPIFGVNLMNDVGLPGNPVQSKKRATIVYDSAHGYWKAEGIPTVPYDDKLKPNYYSMVKIVAKDAKGKTIATTKTVLPVSDEMNCSFCHTSEVGDPAAMPSHGWVNDPNPDKDWKRNILSLHDDKNSGNPLYAAALAVNQFSTTGLLTTSDSGNPMLCADCHSSNALGKPGISGIKQLTTAVHSWHAVNAMDDNTGMPLDLTTDRSACYYCHPGSTTQCLRGVMGKAVTANGDLLLQCQSCHGAMSRVGAEGRAGWVDLPSCQNCHYQSDETGSYVRDTSVFDSSGNVRQATSIFSTGPNLYKMSSEHGGVQCEACHGSTHAEYPSSEANDNVQSMLLQNYPGTVTECSVCHPKDKPVTRSGGPHGIHTIGQKWVDAHGEDVIGNIQSCTVCHGKDYKGTFLSKTSTKRKLDDAEGHKKTFSSGHIVSCFDCHNSFQAD